MISGFSTASGKPVSISEEALAIVRSDFAQLDEGISGLSASDRPVIADLSNASGSDGNVIPKSSIVGRTAFKRASAVFRSPVVKSPRIGDENDQITSENQNFIPKAKLISDVYETPIKSKGNISGKFGNVTPIKLLTPYCSHWRICIKVTSVDEIRFNRGSPIFAFSGVDESGVEIRVCAYNDIAQKVAEIIHLEKMYYITQASIKETNRRYSRSQHDMEVVLRHDSKITECTDRPPITSPKIRYLFVRLDKLPNYIDSEIDILGVMTEVGAIKELTSKSGDKIIKRDIQITDQSGYWTTMTLWGQKAVSLVQEHLSSAIAVKGLFVRVFGASITLVTGPLSKVVVNPSLGEAIQLLKWYANERHRPRKAVSSYRLPSFDDHVWLGQMSYATSPQTFTVVGMITSINHQNAIYKGCANELCKKKLLMEKGNDLCLCLKCGASSEDYKYYYTLRMEISDFTGVRQVCAFNDCGEKILEEEADELVKFQTRDIAKYQVFFKNALFRRFMFRLEKRHRQQSERSPDMTGANYWTVVQCTSITFDEYIKHLQNILDKSLVKNVITP